MSGINRNELAAAWEMLTHDRFKRLEAVDHKLAAIHGCCGGVGPWWKASVKADEELAAIFIKLGYTPPGYANMESVNAP